MCDIIMVEFSLIEKIDFEILMAVNGSNSLFMDFVMWWLSDRLIWIPLYLVIAASVLRRFGWLKGGAIILMAVAMIGLVDQTCASVIRPAFARLRPSSPDNPVSAMVHIVNGYHGGRYGFPSCHAANTFAFALFMSLVFRNRYVSLSLIGWSVLVSYSRIYLGVHYPGDIAGGFIVGATYAILCYLSLRLIPVPARITPLPMS